MAETRRLPAVPADLTEPTYEDALAARQQLVTALRGIGIFMTGVYVEDDNGRPCVAIKGKINTRKAVALAELLENQTLSLRPAAAPRGTKPIDADPSTVKVGDYLPLDGVNRKVLDMRGRQGTTRVLHLEGIGNWVMTGPRLVYRPSFLEATG